MADWNRKADAVAESIYLADPEDEHPMARSALRDVEAMRKRLARADKESKALKWCRKLLADLEFREDANISSMIEGADSGTLRRIRNAIAKIDDALN